MLLIFLCSHRSKKEDIFVDCGHIWFLYFFSLMCLLTSTPRQKIQTLKGIKKK
jgi:hypothetical protein